MKRSAALSHAAELSVPQPLQMALFALDGLIDREQLSRDTAKERIRA